MKQLLAMLTSLLLTGALIGCTSNSDLEEDSGNNSSNTGRNITTDCGVLLNGSVSNTVNTNQGIEVLQIRMLEPNLYIIATEDGNLLVSLVGIEGVSSLRRSAAMARIGRFLNQKLYFFPAADCTKTVVGGGTAAVGSLITIGGTSFNEILLEEAFTTGAATGGSCGESQITSCYQALVETGASQTAGSISSFLWKPQSERDGRLVVLTNVCGVTVVVNGETLTNSGPSNGRCTTARSGRSGCQFGTAQVQIISPSSGLPYSFPDGSTVFTIANGCDRVEFG
jgi:hypothetical protein